MDNAGNGRTSNESPSSQPTRAAPDRKCPGIPYKCLCTKVCTVCSNMSPQHLNIDCPKSTKYTDLSVEGKAEQTRENALQKAIPAGARKAVLALEARDIICLRACNTLKSWVSKGFTQKLPFDSCTDEEYLGLLLCSTGTTLSALQMALEILETESQISGVKLELIALIQESLYTNKMAFTLPENSQLDPRNISALTYGLVVNHPISKVGGKSKVAVWVGVDYGKRAELMNYIVPSLQEQPNSIFDSKTLSSELSALHAAGDTIEWTDWLKICEKEAPTWIKFLSCATKLWPNSSDRLQVVIGMVLAALCRKDCFKEVMTQTVWSGSLSTINWILSAFGLCYSRKKLLRRQTRKAADGKESLVTYVEVSPLTVVRGVAIDNIDIAIHALLRSAVRGHHMTSSLICEWPLLNLSLLRARLNCLLTTTAMDEPADLTTTAMDEPADLTTTAMDEPADLTTPAMEEPTDLTTTAMEEPTDFGAHSGPLTDDDDAREESTDDQNEFWNSVEPCISIMEDRLGEIEAVLGKDATKPLRDGFANFNSSSKTISDKMTLLYTILEFDDLLRVHSRFSHEDTFLYPTSLQQERLDAITDNLHEIILQSHADEKDIQLDKIPLPKQYERHEELGNDFQPGFPEVATHSNETTANILRKTFPNPEVSSLAAGDQVGLKYIMSVIQEDDQSFRNCAVLLGLFHLEKNYLELNVELLKCLGIDNFVTSIKSLPYAGRRIWNLEDIHMTRSAVYGVYEAFVILFNKVCPKDPEATLFGRAMTFAEKQPNSDYWKRVVSLVFGPLHAVVLLHYSIRHADFVSVMGLLKSQILPYMIVMDHPNYYRLIIRTLEHQMNTEAGRRGLVYLAQGAGFVRATPGGSFLAFDEAIEQLQNLVWKKQVTDGSSEERIVEIAYTAQETENVSRKFEQGLRDAVGGLKPRYQDSNVGKMATVSTEQRRSDEDLIRNGLPLDYLLALMNAVVNEDLPSGQGWDALGYPQEVFRSITSLKVQAVLRTPVSLEEESFSSSFRDRMGTSGDSNKFDQLQRENAVLRQVVAQLSWQQKGDVDHIDVAFSPEYNPNKSALFSAYARLIAEEVDEGVTPSYACNSFDVVAFDLVVLDILTSIHRLPQSSKSFAEIVKMLADVLRKEAKRAKEGGTLVIGTDLTKKNLAKGKVKKGRDGKGEKKGESNIALVQLKRLADVNTFKDADIVGGLKLDALLKNRKCKGEFVYKVIAAALKDLEKEDLPISSVLLLGRGAEVANFMDKNWPVDSSSELVYLRKGSDGFTFVTYDSLPDKVKGLKDIQHFEGDQICVKAAVDLTQFGEVCMIGTVDSDLLAMMMLYLEGKMEDPSKFYIRLRKDTIWDIKKFCQAVLKLFQHYNLYDIIAIHAGTGTDYNPGILGVTKPAAISIARDGEKAITADGSRHLIDESTLEKDIVTINEKAGFAFLALAFISLLPSRHRGELPAVEVYRNLVEQADKGEDDLPALWRLVREYVRKRIATSGRSLLVPSFSACQNHLSRSGLSFSLLRSGYRALSFPHFEPESFGFHEEGERLIPIIDGKEIEDTLKALHPIKKLSCGCRKSKCTRKNCSCRERGRCSKECLCRHGGCNLGQQSVAVLDSMAESVAVLDSMTESVAVLDSMTESVAVLDSGAESVAVLDSGAESVAVLDSGAESVAVLDSGAESVDETVLSGSTKRLSSEGTGRSKKKPRMETTSIDTIDMRTVTSRGRKVNPRQDPVYQY